MEFSVRVVWYDTDDEPRPREDVTVMVFDNRHFWNTGSLEETTDEDGVASFDCDWQVGAWDGNVKIFVGDQEGVDYDINDGYEITIRHDFD